jgi:hypothetical protein
MNGVRHQESAQSFGKGNFMSEKKPFAKLRNLVVASTIAVGAMLSASGCGSCCDTGPAPCADPCQTSWDYAHGGARNCGSHSCGGRD